MKGVETALRDVRQLTAELQDQQEEVSTEDLLGLAAVLLQSYLELNNISEYLVRILYSNLSSLRSFATPYAH